MEYVMMILILLLLLALFFLWNLKRSIRLVQADLEKKFKTKSNTLLTSPNGDKDLSKLIETLNLHMKELLEQETSFEQKNQRLRKMITNISHDLRTPLTSALGYIELLSRPELSEEEQQKDRAIIEERLKRLSELVNSFFEFSRIVLYEDKPPLSEINLVAVMETAISNHYEDYRKEDRSIVLKIDQPRIFLFSNAHLLLRIFDNLIHNAYQHSTGTLTISIVVDSTIQIVFSNAFIDRELDPDQIFDEFYTIDISRTKGNTGLGLAIVKEFTTQLNGTIAAQKKNEVLEIVLEFPKKETI